MERWVALGGKRGGDRASIGNAGRLKNVFWKLGLVSVERMIRGAALGAMMLPRSANETGGGCRGASGKKKGLEGRRV